MGDAKRQPSLEQLHDPVREPASAARSSFGPRIAHDANQESKLTTEEEGLESKRAACAHELGASAAAFGMSVAAIATLLLGAFWPLSAVVFLFAARLQDDIAFMLMSQGEQVAAKLGMALLYAAVGVPFIKIGLGLWRLRNRSRRQAMWVWGLLWAALTGAKVGSMLTGSGTQLLHGGRAVLLFEVLPLLALLLVVYLWLVGRSGILAGGSGR